MIIDWSINLGNMLTICSFLVGGLYFVWAIKADTRVLAVRLDGVDKQFINVQDELKKMGEVLIAVARQDARLNAMDERLATQGKRLDDLSARVNVLSDSK